MSAYEAIARRSDITDAEWLAIRKTGIGGSDAAGIAGLSEYDTPVTVWADKTGKADALEDNEAMRFGRDMESYIANRFSEVSGIRTAVDDRMLRSVAHPVMMANIDRWAVIDEESPESAGLEIKGTSPYNADKYADGSFPLRFYAQCVHYMAVTGATSWYLAVYLYGVDLKIYQMTRDRDEADKPPPDWMTGRVYVPDEEIDALIAAEEAFWEYVVADAIPIATGAEADTKAIGTLYEDEGGDEDGTVDLADCLDDLNEREELKAAIDRLDTEVRRIDNRVKQTLGHFTTGETYGWRVTWRAPKNGGTRRFRVSKVTNEEDN